MGFSFFLCYWCIRLFFLNQYFKFSFGWQCYQWFTKIVKCFQLQKIKLRKESDQRSFPTVGFEDGNQFAGFVIKFKIQITTFRQSGSTLALS